MKPTKILVVDDERTLLRNLASYLGSFSDEFEVTTAPTGEKALEVLGSAPDFEVLLTDVRLPGIDGIELVREAKASNPDLRILVMTAYPSREMRVSATSAGALKYLEKPLDLKHLRAVLLETTSVGGGWSGSVGGLDIFDFTQLFSLSGKTTAIRVSYGDSSGHLVFDRGELVHASTADLEGESAFYSMAKWGGGTFEEVSKKRLKKFKNNISASTSHLMMEAARLRDEEGQESEIQSEFDGDRAVEEMFEIGDLGIAEKSDSENRERKENGKMAIKDHLAEFEDIQGFQGAAAFTAQGEMLEGIAKGKLDIKTVGLYANNALLNAQKATDQMEVGRGNMVQIRAPKAVVLMRCLNEATDFAATKEGKAHIHAVVVMDPEGNTGMAAVLLDKAVGKIADEVR